MKQHELWRGREQAAREGRVVEVVDIGQVCSVVGNIARNGRAKGAEAFYACGAAGAIDEMPELGKCQGWNEGDDCEGDHQIHQQERGVDGSIDEEMAFIFLCPLRL